MNISQRIRRSLGVVYIVSILNCTSAYAAKLVPFQSDFRPNTIVISIDERALYLVRDEETALRYSVAVPKPGKEWFGWTFVNGKYLQPAWEPPDEVIRDKPKIRRHIPGGDPGNPMGAAALTLDRHEIAIHGVARGMEKTIGTEASYGCIRMSNADILDLYSRVSNGTRVFVSR